MKGHIFIEGTTRFSTGLLLCAALSGNSWAVCAVASGGDANITVTQTQGLLLGKLVTPDSGQSATIGLNANGVRTIPANINIGSTNQLQYSDSYQVSTLNITGSADCKFQITVGALPSRVSNVTLRGISGTSLDTNQSGAIGTLSATGTATVQVGADVTINGTDNVDLNENVPITVYFVP